MADRPGAVAAHPPRDALLELSRRLCRWGAWFGGVLLIVSSVLITVEIVLRKVFNSSTGGADELTGYALAAASAWAFGFAVLERAHIRITSLYILFPKWAQAVLDVVAVASLLLFFGLVLYFGAIMFAESVRLGSHSRTGLSIPLVIPQFVWLAGLVLAVAVTALLLVRVVLALIGRDIRRVRELAGTKSESDELEEELAALARSGAEARRVGHVT
jgi:TRAP-type C4-dicarboxylate transport system permease small subunit